MTVVEAYLALGSNMGDRNRLLSQAVKALAAVPQIELQRISAVYETDPVGYVEQEAFLNMAVAVQTTLTPERLLDEVLSIEQQLGRVRTVRWGPRTIDLDILLYGDQRVDTPALQIPHPAMAERAFVLIPLADIWPQAKPLPVIGKTIDQCLVSAVDARGVKKWGTIAWETGFDPSAN
ncbi:2-amino-4-hydroxy-6-hydroxymethyldihydropteridine diphosphokinase [Brevibacillus fulvus]|uniref:2-amino-4-hydroxy-6-hydroxymethyldihydropteridine diphosphokinase n=1 Tax=Brevibacillus fulvus TaxID=1125967 RepID=A0A938XY02_9BACL|nr:2-amino-4-hydroxy-6-hydroxymethyldihydropteridine diphosphokinase [Brevibacillus fulvus]MBM7592282.1 2-amino-4-hydroxy-6-hydroxymethyldihydropteridine diphosphokinase [Brevibacillus fulvus]